jgi:hypothetical protein
MNKSFIIGFLVGSIFSLVVSYGLFNYYVNQKVDAAKIEAKENLEKMKNLWEEEYKEKTTQLLKEKKDAFLNKLYDKMTTKGDTTKVDSLL